MCAALAAVVLLGACTGDGEPDGASRSRSGSAGPGPGGGDPGAFADRAGAEIVAAAEADLASVTSLRVSGAVASGGIPLGIDLSLDRRGRCTGSLDIPSGAVELRGIGGRIWMRPDDTYWRSVPGVGADRLPARVGGRWVVVARGDRSFGGPFRGFCDIDELVRQLSVGGGPGSAYVVVGTGRVGDSDVVRVEERDADGGSLVLSVLLDAPHHVVRIERTGGVDPGAVTLSEFGVPVTVHAPRAHRTLDPAPDSWS